MSLDVYLTIPGAKVRREGSGIFVRHAGSIREITREEWDAVNPGAEPFTAVRGAETGEVYSANITHGLWKMAYAAGIHEALWMPEVIGITHARQLIEPLTDGLLRLRLSPDEFAKYNPANGWGSYDALIGFVSGYLAACINHPDAEVSVSR